MTWAANTGGGWTHSGTDLDVLPISTAMPGTGSLVVQMFDPSQIVAIDLFGSEYLDTCYRIYSTGSGGNIVIRKRTLGVLGNTNLATAVHSLSDGDAYTLEVRWVSGDISVYINGATTPLWTYTTDGSLGDFSAIGIETEVDGARVGSIRLYTLERTFAQLADVAWWVAGGTLYASDSGRGGARSIGAFFDPSARIRSAEGKQHAYIIDGSHIVDFDAAAMTASLLSLSAGTMPGQTSLNTPLGATDATAIAWNNDRLILASQNEVRMSAIGFGTPSKSFDLAVDDIGKAVSIGAKVGQPINGLFVQDRNRLIFTSVRAAWDLSGDPALGAELGQLSTRVGATGPCSALMVEGGAIFMHTNEGAVVIPPGGNIRPLSRDVLTDIVQSTDDLTVSLCPDIKRHGVWAFLTPSDEVSTGRSLFYDERIGAYDPAAGGWFPIDFADADIQPTCCMNYQGEVVFGTRDGRMLFIDAAATDDAGTAFTSYVHLNMLRDPNQDMGTMLRSFDLTMGLGSDNTTLTVLGGDTPERAFTAGFTLWTGTMQYPRNGFPVMGSAGALVLKVSGTGRWALEAVQVESQPAVLVPTRHVTALTPANPCEPPAASPTPPADDTGGGPGPGGEDPQTCTACATWMGENQTDTIGGQPAYRLAGPGTLSSVQAEAAAAAESLRAQNICEIGATIQIYVTVASNAFIDAPSVPAQPMAYDTLMQLDPGNYDPEVTTWMAYFRCVDQGT